MAHNHHSINIFFMRILDASRSTRTPSGGTDSLDHGIWKYIPSYRIRTEQQVNGWVSDTLSLSYFFFRISYSYSYSYSYSVLQTCIDLLSLDCVIVCMIRTTTTSNPKNSFSCHHLVTSMSLRHKILYFFLREELTDG